MSSFSSVSEQLTNLQRSIAQLQIAITTFQHQQGSLTSAQTEELTSLITRVNACRRALLDNVEGR